MLGFSPVTTGNNLVDTPALLFPWFSRGAHHKLTKATKKKKKNKPMTKKKEEEEEREEEKVTA